MLHVKVIHPNFWILLFNYVHETKTIQLFLFHHLTNKVAVNTVEFVFMYMCMAVSQEKAPSIGCWAVLIYHLLI